MVPAAPWSSVPKRPRNPLASLVGSNLWFGTVVVQVETPDAPAGTRAPAEEVHCPCEPSAGPVVRSKYRGRSCPGAAKQCSDEGERPTSVTSAVEGARPGVRSGIPWCQYAREQAPLAVTAETRSSRETWPAPRAGPEAPSSQEQHSTSRRRPRVLATLRMPCSLILGPSVVRRTCCSAANTESKQSGRMTLCAASVFVSCNSGLGCVWVRIPAVDAGSAAGGLVRRRSARRSVVERTPVELGCGLGRCGAPEVPENGGEVNRSRLSQRVPAPEGDGARGADRLGRRPALANPRGISRTPSLRGPDGIKGVSLVNRHVQESHPVAPPPVLGSRGGKPLGGGVQRWSNCSCVARNAG